MIIYLTTNTINNKKYVGQSYKNGPTYLGSGKLLIKSIKKYGKENFKKEILEECNSLEHLNERERYWINYFNATESDLFYNVHPGGSNRFYINNSPDKEDIIKRQKATRKQTLLDNPHIVKQAALKAKQTKEKYPQATDSISKAVLCYDLNGVFLEKFKSISKASKSLNVSGSGIIACMKGKILKNKNFMFRYFNGEIVDKIDPYKHPLEGKERPKELMSHIHNSNKGKKRTDTQKLKMSLIPRKSISLEVRLKMSSSAKGKVRSKEHQNKLNESQQIPILHYDLNYNLVNEYSSLKEAAKLLGVTSSTICGHLKSIVPVEKRKKFILKYKNN